MSDEVIKVNISLLIDPIQPMRSDFEQDALTELSQSIKQNGLINPITVRRQGDKYEVVAGHRRFRACLLAGQTDVPVVVRELTDDEVVNIMAAENLERQDVDPVDESIMIGRMLQSPAADIDSVAKRLNRSRVWVEERLEIMDYPDYLIAVLKDGKIKLGVAKWLGRITDDAYRKMYVDSAVRSGMSVQQAEYLYRQFAMGILTPSEQIMPTDNSFGESSKVKARAVCAKCGVLAVEPNLKMVFIHSDCPEERSDS